MEKEKQNPRQLYKKPVLQIIRLASEEVLGTGCKTDTGINTGGGPPCNLQNCDLAIYS